jgi:FlaG/FlaF family flagellin (archaellin)
MGNTTGKYLQSIGLNNASGQTVALSATMKSTGINANITSKGVALFTTDGGKTWTCTLNATYITAANGALDPKYVPGACR